MTKLDAGLMTPLPASDSGSATVWGSKRINPRPQSCLCLTCSGYPSNDDDDDDDRTTHVLPWYQKAYTACKFNQKTLAQCSDKEPFKDYNFFVWESFSGTTLYLAGYYTFLVIRLGKNIFCLQWRLFQLS